MRHHCSRCASDFFDDSLSSSPPAVVFCVFCGAPLRAPPATHDEVERRVPFSAEFPREEASALGVISSGSSAFPDTLKQFRAAGRDGTPRPDSLSPVHAGRDESEPRPELDDGQARKFWASLSIGLGVGALAAAIFAQRSTSPAPVSAAPPLQPVRAAAAPVALSGCAVTSAAPLASVALPAPSSAPSVTKPPVTPALERSFWLERARAAQRGYRLTDAERFYRRVLTLSPRDSEALAGVGELALLRGTPAVADAHFREALESNPDYLPALVGLADLRWESGDAEAARRQYTNIVEHYSDDLYPPYVKLRLEADACSPRCP